MRSLKLLITVVTIFISNAILAQSDPTPPTLINKWTTSCHVVNSTNATNSVINMAADETFEQVFYQYFNDTCTGAHMKLFASYGDYTATQLADGSYDVAFENISYSDSSLEWAIFSYSANFTFQSANEVDLRYSEVIVKDPESTIVYLDTENLEDKWKF